MKLTKIISIALAVSLLSSCAAGGAATSGADSSADAAAVSVSASDKAEIQQLIADFKAFSFSYILSHDVMDWVSDRDFVITEKTSDSGKTYQQHWYRVIDGEITTYQQFEDTLTDLCTDNMIGSISDTLNSVFKEQDGNLYLSEYAGYSGGVMGSDAIFIHSLEPVSDDTVRVNMISYGDMEYWEYDEMHKAVNLHFVQVKKENGQWRIDECDINTLDYIAWLYKPEFNRL